MQIRRITEAPTNIYKEHSIILRMQKEASFFIKGISILQIYILVFSIFSVVFIVAESNVVSAKHALWHFWGDSPKPVEPTKPSVEFKSTGTATATATGPTHIVSGLPSGQFATTGATTTTYSEVTGYRTLPDGGAQLMGANNVPIGEALNPAQFKDFQTAVANAGGTETQIGGYQGKFFGTGGTGILVDGLLFAAAVAGAIQLIGGLVGLDKSLTDSLSVAAGAGN